MYAFTNYGCRNTLNTNRILLENVKKFCQVGKVGWSLQAFYFAVTVVYAGDGFCRSEAVVALYLQKKESAKRIYSTLVHSKTNTDGYKDLGILLVRNSVIFSIACRNVTM